MIILILIDVQYSQKAVFRFDSNGQNHSSLGVYCSVKKSLQAKFPIPPLGGDSPHSLSLFGKA